MMLSLGLLLSVPFGCHEPADEPQPEADTDADSDSDTDTDTDTDADTDSGTDSGMGPAPALVFSGARPRNLLVVSVDTFRRDHVGFFDSRGHTPNLTAVFSEGVVLQRHRSCSSWTSPSVLCAQTGRFPLDDGYWHTYPGVADRDPNVDWPPLEQETLASVLAGQGYATKLVTANSMFSTSMAGVGWGFQDEAMLHQVDGDVLVDQVLEDLPMLTALEGPWYYHVHFIDPHTPYDVTDPTFLPDPTMACEWDFTTALAWADFVWNIYPTLTPEDQVRAIDCVFNAYGAKIRRWDSEFARMWAALEKQGLLEDTLVVLWADHGEQMDEHDEFEHGQSLFEQENGGIAAFWSPGLQPVTWTGNTSHGDIAPTVLEAMGLSDAAKEMTGAVVGMAPDDRPILSFLDYYGREIPQISLVQGDLKLVYFWNGTKALYDLGLDEGETVDLYDSEDERVKAMWDLLMPTIELTQKNWPGLKPVDPGP